MIDNELDKIHIIANAKDLSLLSVKNVFENRKTVANKLLEIYNNDEYVVERQNLITFINYCNEIIKTALGIIDL